MLSLGFSTFILREPSFAHCAFPRWQSVLVITCIGLLMGLDPSLRSPPGMPAVPLWLAIGTGLSFVWAGFLICLGVLRWWMRRGGRWDGQGSLFNLLAASWLVADVLGSGLTLLGVPPLLTLPLWMYSIWVGGNALSGAIPRASLAYSIGGILISLIPMLLAVSVLGAVYGMALAMLNGLVPPPMA